MIKNVANDLQVGDQPDHGSSHEQKPDIETLKDAGAEPSASEPFIGRGPNLRLLVESDEARGGLLYRLVNRLTGEVVSEITRDDLARHNANPNYTVGAWLDTRA